MVARFPENHEQDAADIDHLTDQDSQDRARTAGSESDFAAANSAARDFALLMPWGTPDQVLEKVAFIKDTIDTNGVFFNFSFAGMPYDVADQRRNL